LHTNHPGIDIHNHYNGVLTPSELLDVTGYKEDYVRVLGKFWVNFKDDSLKGDLLRNLLTAEQITTGDNDSLPSIDVETAQNIVINLLSARNGTDYNLVYSFRRYLQQGVNQKQFLRAVIKNLKRQNINYAELQGSLARSISFDDFRQMLYSETRLDIRFLTLVNTKRLVAEPSNPEKLLILDDIKALSTVGQRWTVGLDIAGPESKMFTHIGMERFQLIYEQIKLYAQQKNATFVIRVHVGEGYFKKGESQEDNRFGRLIAQSNVSLIIETLKTLRLSDQVIIRLGHVTHATPSQLSELQKLGIIIEANLTSNLVTGSAATSAIREQVLLKFLLINLKTIINTDAGGVMGTTIVREYRIAQQIINKFKKNQVEITIGSKKYFYTQLPDTMDRIDGYDYELLPPDKKDNFDMENLIKEAEEYRTNVVPRLGGQPKSS
jgi:adenosine deaminase